jgi:ABC-type polysaccharide/polyol phosphate export permease
LAKTLAHGDWIENRPTRGLRALDLRELWRYRELAGFLALRDLKVRYKQAVFGAGWAVLQPLAGVAVFTFVFRRIADVGSDGIPYPVFSFLNLAVWSYFSNTVTRTTQSLVSNSALVTKVYFPRLLAPVSSVFPGVVDLFLSLLLLVVLIAFYGADTTWAALTLPLWLIYLFVVSFGIGLWLGTLNVSYRDVNQGISLLVQLLLFVSPVAYPASSVSWRSLYFLNPMAGVLEGSRWALLGGPWPGGELSISLAVTAVVILAAVVYFQATERRFSDVI